MGTQGAPPDPSLPSARRRAVDPRAIPIAVGYLPVAFAFGLAAVSLRLPTWFAVLSSLLIYAGASQFAALHLAAAGASGLATVLAIWLINLRMALESLSFFRRVRWPQGKGFLALWLTDETFVAASLGVPPSAAEFWRIAWLPYATWVSGTILGALAGSFLPALLRSAFGISIDALFVTLLLTAVRQEPRTLWAAATGAAAALAAQALGGWALTVGMVAGALAYLAVGAKSAKAPQ